MKNSCEQFQDLLAEGMTAPLADAQATVVREHLATCGVCRAFETALRADHDALTDFALEINTEAKELPQRVRQRLMDMPAQPSPSRRNFWRGLMHNRISQLAAAVMVLGVALGMLFIGNSSVWAQTLAALDKAEYVHITMLSTSAKGVQYKNEWWFHVPVAMREDFTDHVWIDNGTERLRLDLKARTAQLAESRLEDKPLSENGRLRHLDGFGNRDYFKRAPSEDTADVEVYSIDKEIQGHRILGKAWIDKKTRLPLREISSEGAAKSEVVFSYDPIAPEIFSTKVPDGFKELPREQRGAVSGKILDEKGQPVADAEVHLTPQHFNSGQKHALISKTRPDGSFSVALPLDDVDLVFFPVMVVAFRADQPDRVAWTLIRSPDDKRTLGGEVPGIVGQVTQRTQSSNGMLASNEPTLAGASDVALTMGPAGRIHGRVLDAEGRPIPDAAICVTVGPGDGMGNAAYTGFIGIRALGAPVARSDKDGNYEIPSVPPLWGGGTRYDLTASAAGHVQTTESFYPNSDSGLTSKGPLTDQEMNFTLYKADLLVRGKATDNTGRVLAGYEVRAQIGSKPYNACFATTDEKGKFILKNCPVTSQLTVCLLANHKDYSPAQLKRTYYPPVVQKIPYTAGKLDYDIQLVAQVPDLKYTIVVKDGNGKPVPQWYVQLRSEIADIFTPAWTMDAPFEKRTDEEGKCTFTNVPRVDQLELFMCADSSMWNAKPPTEAEAKVRAENARFRPRLYPLEWSPGQKEYVVEINLDAPRTVKRD